MKPSIRDASPDDANEIERILIGVIDHGGLTALTAEQIKPAVTSKITQYLETGVFIVAVSDRIIGFQYAHPYPGLSQHVLDIATFTDITLRQTGIGRLMISETIARARQKGYHKITARIRGDNTNGIPYYTRSGFRHVGTYKDHSLIDGKHVDQVLTEYIL